MPRADEACFWCGWSDAAEGTMAASIARIFRSQPPPMARCCPEHDRPTCNLCLRVGCPSFDLAHAS